jgi:hypothetical protein
LESLHAEKGEQMIHNIRDYGAASCQDSTIAIQKAIKNCNDFGGGEVFIPKGEYYISRQGGEPVILQLGNNTVIRGESNVSVLRLKYTTGMDFCRAIGSNVPVKNVTISNLRIDGGNPFTEYKAGETPEQNHGIYFRGDSLQSVIQNITIENVLVENCSGDNILIGAGCRDILVSNCTIGSFLRQGITISGTESISIIGLRSTKNKVLLSGTTIHCEDDHGISEIIVNGCDIKKGISLSGARKAVVCGNSIFGGIGGNKCKNIIINGNTIEDFDGEIGTVVRFGMVEDFTLTNNQISKGVVYVWGAPNYAPEYFSRRISICGNNIDPKQANQEQAKYGIKLTGSSGGIVANNIFSNCSTVARLTSSVKDVLEHGNLLIKSEYTEEPEVK